MWLARNKTGELVLLDYEPFRVENLYWCDKCDTQRLYVGKGFEDLTWESEPIEVELVSKEFIDSWRKRNEYMKKYLM